MFPLLAPVASGQLRDSRGSKSTTIHPLQSLSTPLPGAETGPCKCSLFWQTHSLHLHGTPYEASWNEVRCFFFVVFNCKKASDWCDCHLLFIDVCVHSECDSVRRLTFFIWPYRGNSKYHYYGIRVKPDSPLNRLQEDMQYMALRQQPVQQKQR